MSADPIYTAAIARNHARYYSFNVWIEFCVPTVYWCCEKQTCPQNNNTPWNIFIFYVSKICLILKFLLI